MADIYETENNYTLACSEKRLEPNPTVMTILQFEMDENIILCNKNTSLYLAGNNKVMTDTRLTDVDMDVFEKWLTNNTYVIALDLRFNNITDKGALSIAKLLTKNFSILKLNLMCNDIGSKGAQYIAASLHKNKALKSLRMTGNKIGDKGGVYFAEALQINEQLEELDLGDCDLGINAVVALTTVLHSNKTLKSLNVSRPILKTIEEDIFNHYGSMLKANKTLNRLHMRKHDIKHLGAISIAEALSFNKSLIYLDLSCNRITLGGASKIADLLKQNTNLQTLDLSFNLISDEGAVNIAQALALYNTNLIKLSVVKNELTGKGLCSLAQCLFNNQTLQEIYVTGNQADEAACIAFKKVIDLGRLTLEHTDVVPYTMETGEIAMAWSNNGIMPYYYWAPTYGENAQPELSRYVKFPCPELPQLL